MENQASHLLKKHEELLQDISEYTKSTLAPVAQEYDESEKFPTEFLPYFFENGIFDLLNSQSKIDLSAFLEVIRIVSSSFASLASILLTQGFYSISPLYHFGTEEQKDRYLDHLNCGKRLGGFGFSEEYSGADISYLETTAWETEQGWTLEGSKHYISNAPVADLFLIVAKAKKLNGENGIGIFIVERSEKGLTVEKAMDKMGIKSLPVASIRLKTVQVGHDALLGGSLDGETQVQHIMNLMKLSVSMQAIGISQGSFKKGMHYLSLVRKFGNRLIDNVSTQETLADISTQIYAAEAFTRQIILTNPQGLSEVAMSKILTAKTAIETTETMIQLTGGYGYMKDSDIERYVRDAKVTAIYGGSSSSQKQIVAAPWLKE